MRVNIFLLEKVCILAVLIEQNLLALIVFAIWIVQHDDEVISDFQGREDGIFCWVGIAGIGDKLLDHSLNYPLNHGSRLTVKS